MKYTRSEIKQVVEKLIFYFRKQEEISSTDEMLELFERIENTIYIKKRRRSLRFWSYISAAAVLCGFIWLGVEHIPVEKDDLTVVAANMLENVVETDEIQLVVSSKKTFQVKDGGIVAYSKNGNVKVGEDDVSAEKDTESHYDQMIVPRGRVGQLVLADGSKLYINSGTKVVYPKSFDNKRREIYVDGEIYIDVTRNENVPFVVKTSQFDVKVLGTAFDVKAYSEYSDKGEVVLLRGSVKVNNHGGDEVMLEPNNKAVVPSDGEIHVTDVDAADYILWTEGILPLRNRTVGEIISDMTRYYNITIVCDDDIKNIRISGKIDLQRGLEYALRHLALTGGFIYDKNEDVYVLKEKN